MTPRAPFRSRAFGLEIEGSFTVAGLPAAHGPAQGPTTRLDVVDGADVDARWRWKGAVRLLEEHFGAPPGAPAARSIDHQPGLGYRLYARHFGLAFVSETGDRVLCAPPAAEPWSWQRFLVGRVLPWAAVLRGREVLHASAVALGGRAVGFVGASGAGKTSLAAHLVLAGAGLLTDDVLALDVEDAVVRAHPGVGILCVRPEERAVIGPEAWRRLGEVLGDSGKTYLRVAREDGPRRLGALCFLQRGGHETGFERVDPPDLRLVLGSTFNESITSPERLRAQFELCADLVGTVPMFRLRAPAGLGAAALAGVVLDHFDAERAVGR